MSHLESRSAKVLSCASCRQRKIKCDKTQPICTQCSRASVECIYPSRKPTRRVPRPRQNELLDRISRLESIVGKADPDKLRQLNLEKILGPGSAGSAREEVREQSTQKTQDPQALKTQDPVKGTTARYLSGEFWENLCEEVEGIKQALEQPSDDDEEEDEGDSPQSAEAARSSMTTSPSGFVFGNPDFHERDQLVHPSRDMMIRLWAIYTRNVDSMMKFLHRPTVAKMLDALAESSSDRHHSPAQNALAFAIYFSAVMCLRPEACRKQLGESQEVLGSRYRICVEQALAAADYLNSNALETLQAFTLYTVCLS